MGFLSNGVLKATPNQKSFCAKMISSKKLIMCYLFCFKKVLQIEFLRKVQKSNFLSLKWSGKSQSKLKSGTFLKTCKCAKPML